MKYGQLQRCFVALSVTDSNFFTASEGIRCLPCPLPRGEGGPRPAFSPAGAGRVRGQLQPFHDTLWQQGNLKGWSALLLPTAFLPAASAARVEPMVISRDSLGMLVTKGLISQPNPVGMSRVREIDSHSM